MAANYRTPRTQRNLASLHVRLAKIPGVQIL